MASTHKHLRSSTANKRPTTAIADGQIALNTNTTSPGLFFKDSTGATIIKVGPVHVGSSAPNASPPAGGSSGNSTGEIWLDTSLTPNGVKIWNGASWTNATPIGSTTVQGLLELATSAETQTGTDPDRAVTPAGLQSKVSDSTSTTSSTTIASSTAVKSAYDLANAALPKSGGTVTGNLEIGTTGSLSFEGATADAFETTIAVVDPTADRTITLPDTTGTVVTTGDTGTVTSTMIADGTIVNGDINASAAIDHSKLANITAGSVLLGNASNVPTATALSGDVTVNNTGVTAISSGVIVNADVNASAAIAGTKISPDFGSQTVQTTGIFSHALGTAGAPTVTFTGDTNTGIYSPGADQVAISTGGSGRLFVDSTGRVGIANSSPARALDITGTLRCSGRFESSSDAIISDWIYIGSASGARGVTSDAASRSLLFGINGSEVARFDTSGRLGVGTSSPGAQFEIIKDSTFNNEGTFGLSITDGTSDVKLGCGVDATNNISFIQSLDPGTAYNTRPLTLNPNGGNVGIGTNSVSNRLQINQASTVSVPSAGASGHCFAAGDSGFGLAAGALNSGNSYLQVTRWDGTAANYNLLLQPNGGSVGIGITSPVYSLDVAASQGNINVTSTTGTNNALLRVNNTGGTGYIGLDSSAGGLGGAYSFNIWHSGSYPIVFANSNTERARIDSSGRLLVGTSTAASTLAIAEFRGSATAPTAGATIALSRGSDPTASQNLGLIYFTNSSGNQAAYISADADTGWGGAGSGDYPGRLIFATTADGASSPTERMRIGQNGSVQIGRTTGQIDTELFTVQNGGQCGWIYQTANSNVVALTMRHTYAQSAQTAKMISFLQNNGAEVGAITSTTTATAYGTSSDYRLKENIASVTDGIARLQQLKPSRFNFIADPDKTVDGFIAHEVQAIVPEAIIGEKDAVDDEGNPIYQGIDQSKLVPLLTAALQEAIGEIESLKARVAALEGA